MSKLVILTFSALIIMSFFRKENHKRFNKIEKFEIIRKYQGLKKADA